jgi:enoyl-CoA hydratase/carnithine racemase
VGVTVAQRQVRLEIEEGVGTIVLDCPPVNCLSRAAQQQLHDAAVQAAEREDVRAVVIRGQRGVFSAGADIKEMSSMAHASMLEQAPKLQSAFQAVADIPKPVVAAIERFALGGGCELALAADKRLCTSDAVIGLPEIRLGVIPGAGGTQRLSRLVGPALAKEMIFTGRPLAATSALDVGLVNGLVSPGQADSAAREWAQQFVGGPALALAAAKSAIDGGADLPIGDALARETALFQELFATHDRDIGMQHFLDHRDGAPPFLTSGV